MATAASLLVITVGFWLACCLVIAVAGERVNHVYAATGLYIGAAGLLLTDFYGWPVDTTFTVTHLGNLPVYLAVAPLTLRIDSLASIFIALLGILTMATALFSPGYLKHLDKQTNKGAYWVQLILFIIGMLGVIVAANAPTFLISWELMALTSALMIATSLASQDSKRAAFIYLGATRIATAFLMTGFLWMYTLAGTWVFKNWQLDYAATYVPAAFMLVAFCIKGGIWPFHEWLPYAHPAAPAPVSALMSGIMIKVALYAMIRIFVGGALSSTVLIYIMLAIGLITAFWGILCALMQKDLKCLLAYSSIENAGLILIAISLALLGQLINLPAVAAISLAAAIFHIFNHGLFKALLFLGAGTVDCRVHTRDLELMGGLGKKMPGTMLCFVIGGAAICSLPPLNGFSSKWLVYQSLFHLAHRTGSLWLGGLAVACIAILGLVSGMSLYCFTKAIGISFLGRSRSPAAANASEGSEYMLAGQGFLAFCCIAIGLLAPLALALIQPVCSSILQSTTSITPFYTIPMGTFAMLLAIMTTVIYSLWLTTSRKTTVREYITWDCGFGGMTKRMQGTATSFAENIGKTFAPLLEYDAHTVIVGRDRRHFPETIQEESGMTSILEAHVYRPSVKAVQWLGERTMHLQAGTIHQYLGYILVTLVALLVIGILI
jgi:hydrogenase-4 component B